MIKLEKILFPTDFSENAAHARKYVIELAKKFGAKVIVIHVVTAPTYAVSQEIAVDVVKIRDTLQQAAEESIEREAELIRKEGVEVETIVDVGSGFVEIIQAARDRKVELIVMATHGAGMLRHLLLGSTAERVVRKAPCPVLTVRHPEHEFVHP